MRRPLLLTILLTAGALSASAQELPHTTHRSANAHQGPEPLLAIDTLLTVDNRGLTRLLVTLNAYRFKLAADPEEVAQSGNAFLIPRRGSITLNIADLLAPDDENPFDDVCTGPAPNGNNCIDIEAQGPVEADAQIIVSDTPVAGQPVAYAITSSDLVPLPDAFGRLGAYPNPFSARTTLTYAIPDARTNGVAVSVVVYDVLGRRVRTLVNARQFPGAFEVVWDGDDERERRVASGLYIVRLEAGEESSTRRVTRLR